MKTLEDLLQKVKELEPLIREHAAEAEANHRLPKVTVEAIRKAGLFRIWVPETLEGWEVDPVTACRTFEEIARIDSATGWLVQMSNAIGALGLFFGDQAVEEMYGGDTIFADALHPQGTAITVEGGVELTGQFPFASACHHADWFLALAKVMDGNEPRLADGVPETRMMSLPMSDAEVVDNWDTLGMRGTGSHDVKVQGAFIPEHRAPAFEPVSEARSRAWSPAMSNLTIWHITVSVGTIPLGIAGAALDEFIALTKSKMPAYRPDALNTQALAHYRLGEAKAILGAARAHMYEILERVWDSAKAGNLITTEQKCDMQLAATHAARAACQAIQLVAASAGTSAVRESSRLTRHLRDLNTLTQHAYVSSDRYEDVGALTVGQPHRWPFFAF